MNVNTWMTQMTVGAAALLLGVSALAEPVADLDGPIGGWATAA